MNWFDTSNITSLAKSALKEAQKTIDKALEITEDASETAKVNSHVNSDCRQQPSISDHLVPDAVAPRMALIGDVESTSVVEPNHEKSPVASVSGNSTETVKSDSGDDEVEISATSLSSDIEVISNPVTDISNYNYPLKINRKLNDLFLNAFQNSERFLIHLPSNAKSSKGHSREQSNSSSTFVDTIDFDKIVRRIIDLNDILDAKDSQFQELQNKCTTLEQQNSEISKQLIKIQNLNEDSDKHSKKSAQLEDEVTELKTNFNQTEELVKQLRGEGEQLSQKILKLNNVIKALRSKEKNDLSTVIRLKELIESVRNENRSLTESLSLKTESEEKNCEKIKQLQNQVEKYQNTNESLKSNFDDLSEKFEVTKNSLNAVKKELLTNERNQTELSIKESFLQKLNNDKLRIEKENGQLKLQIDRLQDSIRKNELSFRKSQEKFEEDSANFVLRIEELNVKNEDLSSQLSDITKPLYKRIEYLQTALNDKTAIFEKQENNLNTEITNLTIKLSETERNYELKLETISKDNNDLKSNYNEILENCQKIQSLLAEKTNQFELLESTFEKEKNTILSELQEYKDRVNIREMELSSLRADNEKLQQDLKEAQTYKDNISWETKSSLAESVNSFKSEIDAEIESKSLYDSLRHQVSRNNPDNLISILKQKDTEIQILKAEINRNENERLNLNAEISKMYLKIEQLEDDNNLVQSLRNDLSELRDKYDALCVMFGEKVEEIDELKLDLQDVFDVNTMYKTQINDLLQQLNCSQ